MKASMSTCKAYKETCVFCNSQIAYAEYGYTTTKPFKYKGLSFAGKTMYYHMECYHKYTSRSKSGGSK